MSPTYEAEQDTLELIRDMGEEITITDKVGTETTVSALIGETKLDAEANAGRSRPITISRTTDFLVPTADLPGEVTLSHRITFNGDTYKPSPINDEPCARDSGRHGLITRIHAVRIANG